MCHSGQQALLQTYVQQCECSLTAHKHTEEIDTISTTKNTSYTFHPGKKVNLALDVLSIIIPIWFPFILVGLKGDSSTLEAGVRVICLWPLKQWEEMSILTLAVFGSQ